MGPSARAEVAQMREENTYVDARSLVSDQKTRTTAQRTRSQQRCEKVGVDRVLRRGRTV